MVGRNIQIWRSVRDADWLSQHRARAYLIILAVMLALTALAYLATSRNAVDLTGRPVGTDFASFWTASRLAVAGSPALAWDPTAHHAAQIEAFGSGAPYAAFFYPPPYLLACLPLALLPYGPSLVAWLALTGLAWAAMTRAWLDAPRDWLLVLAFPAVLLNAGHGQNGFLTAALLGGALLIATSRPWLSGVLVGALVIKPHLAVLTPLFFVLTGNWRAFIAAGATALGLCVLSALAFGAPAWTGFFETSALARQTLEGDLVGYAKMQSAFAAVRLWGASVDLAWGAQIVSAAIGIVGLWRVRKVSDGLAFGAALVCATLLTTPFLLDYDFTVLSVPLAWLYSRARRDGFLPWEKVALLAGFVLPLFSRPLATLLHLPPAPFVIIGLLACIHQRARADRGAAQPSSLHPVPEAA